MTIGQRYSATLRQLHVLEAAYPGLAEICELWYFLPVGRPDGLSRDARYILFAYRAARAARDTLRADMDLHGAEKWAAALEAEAALHWEIERANMLLPLERSVPYLPEFATLTSMLAA